MTSIGQSAFYGCSSLTRITIPNSVTNIGQSAFADCSNLTNVTVGNSVTSLSQQLFYFCPNLVEIYFNGDAPTFDFSVFDGDFQAIVYYLPGTSGWGSTFDGLPTLLWNPPAKTSKASLVVQTNQSSLNITGVNSVQVQTSDGSFGMKANQFGFNITGVNNLVIVVEACTNLSNPTWLPIQTNTLTGGSYYFSDYEWTNHPSRFYRLRSP